MATPVILPKMGQSVESCIITEWYKKVGDPVKKGEPLYEMETDKSAFTENAEIDGVLLAIFHGEGDDVPCLETVAVIGAEGEDFSQFAPAGGSAPAPAAAPAETASAPAAEAAAPAPAEGKVGGAVSPRAQGLADKLHIDTANVPGTGPNGRVIERDVAGFNKGDGSAIGGRYTEAEIEAMTRAAQGTWYEDIKHSNTRKVIAKSMYNSLMSMAQLTHNSSCDATQLNRMRAAIKKGKENGVPNATLNDMLLFAVSRLLPKHKELNAYFFEDKLRVFKTVNLGIAADTPRGLLVPTLFDAEKMDLFEIAAESKKLTTAAKEGHISPDLLKGATFTVTNLGSMGIESFTPIVNPPQTGILGACAITDKVRMKDNGIQVYPSMGLSLTYDHRAMDGVPASRFLKDLVEVLTNFIDFYKAEGGSEYELDL